MYHYPMHRNTSVRPWTMKVTGTGMVAAAPDQAIIITGVETEDMSLQEAQSSNSAAIQKIIDALTKAGVPESQIQTSEFRINPVYDFKEGQQIFRGYKVANLLKITLYDMAAIGSIIDTATANGANVVRGVEFSLQHTDVIYNQALAEALQQAEQKAQTIARSLHATLNAIPHSVIESPETSQPSPFLKATALQAAPTPIEPGQLMIKADVLVSYHYYL
ncbi:SIMPL domain-containing protein [Thalassobacillus devorans]|uniref:SIMPL domain-containing protein n=1 Tax=Thalassobacillus devorans TaxID=279813 RepID=UPI00048CD773|nr:SIMPL domain-containing protein [Thalassobacillus devorans]